MTPQCFYHGRDNLDYIVTFSIGGKVYNCHLANLTQVESCHYIAKRWPLKGFNYAKKHATRVIAREDA